MVNDGAGEGGAGANTNELTNRENGWWEEEEEEKKKEIKEGEETSFQKQYILLKKVSF